MLKLRELFSKFEVNLVFCTTSHNCIGITNTGVFQLAVVFAFFQFYVLVYHVSRFVMFYFL